MPAEACSTGEQKALLIGLVLSQARLVSQLTAETPLILLDEIAAHLDETRRLALFGVLDELGAQSFLTGTDAAIFAPLGERAQMLAVHDGAVDEPRGGSRRVTLDDATAALKRVFGYDGFRDGQAEIVTAVLAGEDVFAVMPTGQRQVALLPAAGDPRPAS